MVFTLELFKYVLFKLIPDVIRHTEGQDEEQVRDHYDSKCSYEARLPPFTHVFVGGDDFYGWSVVYVLWYRARR